MVPIKTTVISVLSNTRNVMELNAKTFRKYEAIHRAKPDEEKANRNAHLADQNEKQLKELDKLVYSLRFGKPMSEHDEGCPMHRTDHICNGQLYLEEE